MESVSWVELYTDEQTDRQTVGSWFLVVLYFLNIHDFVVLKKEDSKTHFEMKA